MQRHKQLFGMLTVTVLVGCARGEELGRPSGVLDTPRLLEHEGGIEGRYVVVLRERDGAMTTADMHALATEHRGAVLGTMGSRAAFSAALAAEDALELSKDPRVMFVEREALFHTVATQVDPTWGLDRIDQAALPLDAEYSYDGDGAGTTVYVIDTGVRASHVDFGGRASEGFTAVDDGNGAADCNGHGTHVSGTIGGATVGVAKGVSIVAVRALDCNGSGPTS
ncbi:MAG TPA: S8 family serine peptidase, partial [Nannocystaceae bacterium]|nr:S8 family serine peptidase [Nannocystaceae bacterium]